MNSWLEKGALLDFMEGDTGDFMKTETIVQKILMARTNITYGDTVPSLIRTICSSERC